MKFKKFYSLLKNSVSDFFNRGGLLFSAALAYYSMITFVPLIIFIIIISSILFGDSEILVEFVDYVTGFGGEEIALFIWAIILEAKQKGVTSIISFIFVVIGSTVLFSNIHTILNKIWNILIENDSKKEKLLFFATKRILSILVIIIIVILLAFSSIFLTIIDSLGGFLIFGFSKTIGLFFIYVLNYAVFFSIFFLFSVFIFKVFLDVHIKFRELWSGSFFTSFLFVIGFILIGFYFRFNPIGFQSGIMEIILALFFIFYYFSVIFVFGAFFSYACFREKLSKKRFY